LEKDNIKLIIISEIENKLSVSEIVKAKINNLLNKFKTTIESFNDKKTTNSEKLKNIKEM
jgi:predicted  nucleic acid-binding Zn-ribbon protein